MLVNDIDAIRRSQGYQGVFDLLRLGRHGVVVLDPYSTLISEGVRLGAGTVLYPNVVVRCDERSGCAIGEGNTLWPQTLLLAVDGGVIEIGDGNQLGPGGVQLKANQVGARIVVGDGTRLLNGPEIVGRSSLGSGCQVLGQIAAQSVTLAAGREHTWPDVDERGAVLKGFGVARGLSVGVGEVINGHGDFAAAPIERQAAYHARPSP
ncbi:hypothetical protein GCM10009682_34480 [Luedemannella flava]|uniref:Uncharacterized protein n=1 Tax=Luedemannella flava TaxID=349316 RepID=A0ABP4YBH9_9ACTN